MSEPTFYFPPPTDPPSGRGSAGAEDASSQALSEALASSFQVVKVLMVLLVVLFFCSGVFVVKQNEVAVLLRFGKPVGLTRQEQLHPPGWHWALPYPIDEVVRIPIEQSHTVMSTTGWYAPMPGEAPEAEPMPRGRLSPEADGYVLTADGNILHARATVKYRIQDPLRYTFGFTNVTEILTNVVNNALFYAASQVTADAALYRDKTRFRDLVLGRIKDKIDELQLGINMEPSDVETKAPADVRLAFEAVNTAEQDRGKLISGAQGYRDEVTRRAQGEAQALIATGVTSSNRMVQSVTADATAFHQQLPSYLESPGVFEQRLLVATLQRLMTNASVKFVFPDQVDELRLQLSREPEKAEPKEQP